VKKFLALLLLVNAPVVFAQPDIRWVADLDPIVTWFSPKTANLEKDGGRLGFNGGMSVEVYFKPNYAFLAGLSLTSLGGNLVYREEASVRVGDNKNVVLPRGTSVAYNISYLSFPAALKLRSNEIGEYTYYAQLGIIPQLNIGSRATSSGGLLKRDNLSKEISLFNLSVLFGGGIEYSLGGQTSLVTGIFFHNGFMDIFSSSKHNAGLNYFTFRVGMIF